MSAGELSRKPDKMLRGGGCKLLWSSISNSGCTDNNLLDEIEHNIMNYLCRDLSYLPKLKAEADETDIRIDNS